MTDALVEAMAKAAYLTVVGFDPANIWWTAEEAEGLDARLDWPDNLTTSVNADGYRKAATAALQAIEAAGYRVVSSEGIRQAVDAGLQGFCKDAPDFAMSPKMRQDAVDHILGQPLAAPRVGEGV